MIKRFTLLARKEGLSKEEFATRWLRHGELVAKMPGLKRYVQSHVEKVSYSAFRPSIEPVVDGIAELWFDDLAAMHTALNSPEHDPLIPDGDGLMSAILTIISTEKVFVDGPRDGKLKRISFVRKLEGQTDEDFMSRWHHHGVLVSALPGLRHYVQTHFQSIEYSKYRPSVAVTMHGAGSQWFDDEAAIKAADTSPQHDGLVPDGDGFMGGMTIYHTRERVFIA